MTKNVNSTRYYSHRHEEAVSKIIGGRLEANSGAAMFSAGDILNKDASILCECKTCLQDRDSFSIKKQWLIKNDEERKTHKVFNGCLAFNFGPDKESYFIINESLMKFLIEKLEEENKE